MLLIEGTHIVMMILCSSVYAVLYNTQNTRKLVEENLTQVLFGRVLLRNALSAAEKAYQLGNGILLEMENIFGNESELRYIALGKHLFEDVRHISFLFISLKRIDRYLLWSLQ